MRGSVRSGSSGGGLGGEGGRGGRRDGSGRTEGSGRRGAPLLALVASNTTPYEPRPICLGRTGAIFRAQASAGAGQWPWRRDTYLARPRRAASRARGRAGAGGRAGGRESGQRTHFPRMNSAPISRGWSRSPRRCPTSAMGSAGLLLSAGVCWGQQQPQQQGALLLLRCCCCAAAALLRRCCCAGGCFPGRDHSRHETPDSAQHQHQLLLKSALISPPMRIRAPCEAAMRGCAVAEA